MKRELKKILGVFCCLGIVILSFYGGNVKAYTKSDSIKPKLLHKQWYDNYRDIEVYGIDDETYLYQILYLGYAQNKVDTESDYYFEHIYNSNLDSKEVIKRMRLAAEVKKLEDLMESDNDLRHYTSAQEEVEKLTKDNYGYSYNPKFEYSFTLQYGNNKLVKNDKDEYVSSVIKIENHAEMASEYLDKNVTVKATGGKILYKDEVKDEFVMKFGDDFRVVADENSKNNITITATAEDVDLHAPTLDIYCKTGGNLKNGGCLAVVNPDYDTTLKASHSAVFDCSECSVSGTNPTPTPTPTPTPASPEVISVDINISKIDSSSKDKIAGAHFILTDSSTGTKVSEWDSTSSSKSVTVETGKIYELKESLSPDGYISIGNSIYFSVDSSGKITTYKNSFGNEVVDRADVDLANKSISVKNDYTRIQISKISSTTKSNLAGAFLKICTSASFESDGTDCKPDNADWLWISGSSPKEIDRLKSGIYYLIEIDSPKGYVRQVSTKKFEVKDVSGVQKVEFEGTPTKVTIKKIDNDTKKRVEGATLQILNASDGSIAKDANGTELTWISKADEDWVIYALPIGDYILVEKVIPDEYQEGMIINDKTTNEYKFSITEDEYDIEIEVGNAIEKSKLTDVPNTDISVLNLFAIGGLMVFIGYETIRIYRRKAING